jgi:hypothetical protein
MAPDEALRQARRGAFLLLAAPLVPVALALAVPSSPRSGWSMLVLPAGLIGLAAPVVGYRHYVARRQAAGGVPAERRALSFLHATLTVLAVGEAAAIVGIVVYWFTLQPAALTAVATHVLIGGAVWPTPERLELFDP